MNYEIAKKLKDAGFPLKMVHNSWNGENFIKLNDGLDYYVPNLSELIRSCGGSFSELSDIDSDHPRSEFGWRAMTRDRLACLGDTPEEAVANLWIALNTR